MVRAGFLNGSVKGMMGIAVPFQTLPQTFSFFSNVTANVTNDIISFFVLKVMGMSYFCIRFINE